MIERIDAGVFGRWVLDRRQDRGRLLIGVCGPPGSGKSTLASRVAREIGALVVPMDGFHLPNSVLDERGLRSEKGAPHTFDASAFVEAVRALRRADDVVMLPTFDRTIDEPVAGGVAVEAAAPIVLVEGNYLLLAEPPWGELSELFDAVAYIEVDDDVRVERLIARHVEFGREIADARTFVMGSDERNAALVARSRDRADLIVALS